MITDGARVQIVMQFSDSVWTGTARATNDPDLFIVELDQPSIDNPLMPAERLILI